MPTRLFHISEEAGIECFEPRPASHKDWPDLKGAYVWGIAEEVLSNYLFPRDCPRICCRASSNTNETDRKRFLGHNGEATLYAERNWKLVGKIPEDDVHARDPFLHTHNDA